MVSSDQQLSQRPQAVTLCLWCPYYSTKEEKESDAVYDLRLEEWESSNHQIIT